MWVSDVLDKRTGVTRKIRSRVFVSAVGALSIPRECEIEGAGTFKGALFHSARWDHEFDWGDKEVVVIGTPLSVPSSPEEQHN